MRVLRILSLCLVMSLGVGASDFEWVQLYKEGGARAIEQKIDTMMQTPEFWSEALKEQDTRFGYYEDLKYLFVATKNTPTLKMMVVLYKTFAHSPHAFFFDSNSSNPYKDHSYK